MRIKDTKTGTGRKIDLPPVAMQALEQHRAAMLREGHIAGPVFCDQQGGYLRKGNVCRRSFVPLMSAAGVPRLRFHDLRHTSASLLLAAGENVKTVAERLGHSSVKITLDVYAHVMPTMQQAAAARMQKLFG